MDYSEFDKVRRSAVPLQLDVVEAFAAGRLSRREFIQRATVLGLSIGAIGMVIAACSGDAVVGRAASVGAQHGRQRCRQRRRRRQRGQLRPHRRRPAASIRIASQRPVPIDPVAMQDLGGYGITAQSFEFLCTADPNGIATSRPAWRYKWTPNADGSVWTFDLRQNVKWQDGTPFTADDVVATMERLVKAGNSGLKGVLPPGGAVATDPNTVTFTLPGRQRQLPVPRVGLQRPDADHAEGLCGRDDARQGAGRDRRLEAQDATTPQTGASFERNPDWWGGKTPLDGTEFIFFDATGPMVTAYQGGQVDAIVQFDVLSGQVAARRPELHRHRRRGGAPPPDLDALRHRPVRGQARSARPWPMTFDRPALIQQLFKGKAELGNDHVIWQGYPYYDPSVPQRAQDIAKAKQLLSDAGRRRT